MVLLGNWHLMKMVNICIWRLYAADFIAPLFHMLFPNAKFPWSPRMILVSRIFSLIRLTYPSWRAELETALQKEGLDATQKAHMMNLRDLCQWWIPKVL